AGSKRRNWRSLAFADCSGFFILIFQSQILPSLCVAIVMGCRFILFTISKKGPHFQILGYPKGGW
ncbi:hypothetical protein IX84_32030, partial [Phaeodactylibacter xiamenensis]